MYEKFFKRFIDIILSAIGLIVLFIPMLFVAVAVKIDSPGPVIFKQERVGLKKKSFVLYKFRTMKIGTPDIATISLVHSEDYITKLGSFIRKLSIDEFPQLLNILKGDMSIVGPRPVIPSEEDLISERDKYGVYEIKPGLTGWAQINGRDEVDYVSKARLDAEYMENITFTFDCKCFFNTILKVFKSEGVIEGGEKVQNKYVLKEDTVDKVKK